MLENKRAVIYGAGGRVVIGGSIGIPPHLSLPLLRFPALVYLVTQKPLDGLEKRRDT